MPTVEVAARSISQSEHSSSDLEEEHDPDELNVRYDRRVLRGTLVAELPDTEKAQEKVHPSLHVAQGKGEETGAPGHSEAPRQCPGLPHT